MVSKTIPLQFNYIDVKGLTYNDTIELPPFSSAILIKNGDVINDPLKANAGHNETVTFAANSINLSGSATTADGNILSYLWTKISGPIPDVIANINSDSTSVTELDLGVYQFELKVSDNNGTTSIDTVTITVIPAINVPPTDNAGANKTITLPVNNTALTGSATDTDGEISNYEWTKIAGPLNFNISNSESLVTDVTGLTEGVYIFQLEVRDNKGSSATSTVQITVNPTANIPPIANAGVNKTITLPVNIASLTGSATDSDGHISNYLWEKISGPTNYQIENPNSAIANITGLTEGIYQFQLSVTDDKGATASSKV